MLLKRLLFCVMFALCMTDAHALTSTMMNYESRQEVAEQKEKKRNAKNAREQKTYGEDALLTTGDLGTFPPGVKLYDVCDDQGKKDCLKAHQDDEKYCQCITFFKDQYNDNDVVLQRLQYLSLIQDYFFYKQNEAPMDLRKQIFTEISELNNQRTSVRDARQAVENFCKADPYCRSGSNYYATQEAANKAKQLIADYENKRDNYNSRRKQHYDLRDEFRDAIACSAYAYLDEDDNYRVKCCYMPNKENCEINFTFLFKNNGSPEQFFIDDSIALLGGHIINEQQPLIYDDGVYTNAGGPNICNNVSEMLHKYEMKAKWDESAARCSVYSNTISDVANPIPGGLNAFFDIHFGGHIDIPSMLGFYTSRYYPDLKKFGCASRPARYVETGSSPIKSTRVDFIYVMRCVGTTAKGENITFDFLFDDMSETFDYEIEKSLQVASCYSVGGLLNGDRCQVLGKDACDTLKTRGLDVTWDNELKTCNLNAVSDANAINLAGEILGQIIVAIATIPTGGGGALVKTLGWVVTASEVVETGRIAKDAYDQEQISKAIATILKCYDCHNGGCKTKRKKIPGCPINYNDCSQEYTSSLNKCSDEAIEYAYGIIASRHALADSRQTGLIEDISMILICDKDTENIAKKIINDNPLKYEEESRGHLLLNVFASLARITRSFKGTGLLTAIKTGKSSYLSLNSFQKATLRLFQPNWTKVSKNKKSFPIYVRSVAKMLNGGELEASFATATANNLQALFEDTAKNNDSDTELKKSCEGYKLTHIPQLN